MFSLSIYIFMFIAVSLILGFLLGYLIGYFSTHSVKCEQKADNNSQFQALILEYEEEKHLLSKTNKEALRKTLLTEGLSSEDRWIRILCKALIE